MWFTKYAPWVEINDKKCALGVGTMQYRTEGQHTVVLAGEVLIANSS